MSLDDITPNNLRRALLSWKQGKRLPVELLDLDLLRGEGELSPTQKELRLIDLLQVTVINTLEQHRQRTGKALHIYESAHSTLLDALAADFRSGDKDLEAWSALYFRHIAEHSLPIKDLAQQVPGGEYKQLQRRVKLGLAYLAETLQRAEMQKRAATCSSRLRRYLPPSEYTMLFGVADLIKQLFDWLTDPQGPRFVSIEGLGGIGKTALAQAVALHMAEQANLDDILWLSARQELFSHQGELRSVDAPIRTLDDIVARLASQLGQEQLAGLATEAKLTALRGLLTQHSHLVVIDNLETLADAQTIVPALYPLASATRFLFTSRHSLHSFPYVQLCPVPELSLKDSRALIENELNRRGLKSLLTNEALEAIYHTVGGLPLALKLLAAQMGKLPLQNILKGFQSSQRQSSETLYRYIYRRTWTLLDNPARSLLLSMLDISPDGEDLEWIQTTSALSKEQFEQALYQLIDCSLIEISGPIEEPIYRLHRLTITFLQTDVLLGWETYTSSSGLDDHNTLNCQ